VDGQRRLRVWPGTHLKSIRTVSRLNCYGRFLRRWSLSWVTTRFENCFLINFFYLTLCTFSFEIKESSLSNTRCLIQDVLSPHCGDKRMARRCTRRSLPNYSLSNVSIKTNFQPITRVELKSVQYSQGDYILCMTSRYFFRSFTNASYCVLSHIPMI
jgi:hypothetical protein